MTNKFSFICTKCWNVDDVTIKIDFKDQDIQMHYFKELIVNYPCPKCRRFTHHFYTDRKIAKCVALMNKLGYDTVASCEGHIKFKYDRHKLDVAGGSTCPYIYFKCKKKLLSRELLKDILQAGFNVIHVKDNNYQFGTRVFVFPTEEDFNEIISYNDMAIYYDWDIFVERNKDLKPMEAERKAKRYLLRLYRKFENYLTKHIEETK